MISMLSQLSRCAWKTICQYLEVSLSEKLQPAGILSIATAGDFLNWNPHIHALIASGVFRADGSFVTVPLFQENILRELFEANIFTSLEYSPTFYGWSLFLTVVSAIIIVLPGIVQWTKNSRGIPIRP